jgi:hypothetical protein
VKEFLKLADDTIPIKDRFPGEGRGPCHGCTSGPGRTSHCEHVKSSNWFERWVPAFAGKATKRMRQFRFLHSLRA